MTATWLSSGGKPFNFGVKPATPTIDWSNPLTKGLVAAVDYGVLGGASAGELVSGARGTLSGTTPSIGPFGPQRTFDGNTAQDLYTLAPAQIIPTGGKITGEVLFINNGVNVGSNGNTLLAKGNLTSGQPFFNMRFNPGSPANIELYTLWNGTFASWQLDGLSDSTWYHVVMAYDYSSTSNVPVFYVNGGRKSVATTASPSGSAGADDGSLFLGNTTVAGNTRGLNGSISHGRCWNRILSPGEVGSLYQNPWQVYRTPAPSVALSSGVSYLLSAARGTIAEIGQATSLKAARQLLAAGGNLALAGQVAVLRHGYTLPAGQAGFVQTGQAALFGIKMPVAQGSFALSGGAANLVWTVGGAHSYALTSASGTLVLAGQLATPKVGRKFSIANGVIGLTGKAANLARGKGLVAAQGSCTLSGKALSFHSALSMRAQCGTVALAIEAAGLKKSGWTIVDLNGAAWTPQFSGAQAWSAAPMEETIWTSN